jgi:very-short-patch-repair endonuclease
VNNAHESDLPKHKARSLRKRQTKSEALLWSILRGKQMCGLKFRRQHPIGPFIVDFACVSEKLVVEIDGDYHDYTIEQDMQRERYLGLQGWQVIRFSARDVEYDPEAISIGISSALGIEFEFSKRKGTGSGMMAADVRDEKVNRKDS